VTRVYINLLIWAKYDVKKINGVAENIKLPQIARKESKIISGMFNKQTKLDPVSKQ